MVTSHAHQGVSLQLDMDCGAEAEIKQLRPIQAKEPMEARFRMFVKSPGGNPVKYIKVMLGGKALDLVAVEDDSRAYGEWYEVRSKAEIIAPGTYDFRMIVSNPSGLFGGEKIILNFDELRLRLKSVNRITK